MPGLVANFHLIRKEKFSSEAAWLLRSADPIDKHDVATISSSILVWIFLLKLYVAYVITFGSFLSFIFFTEKSISKKASWHGIRVLLNSCTVWQNFTRHGRQLIFRFYKWSTPIL